MCLVLTVALVMAVMMVASAMPAFATAGNGNGGNSGYAHDCDTDTQAALGVANHGQCVSFFAQGGSIIYDASALQ
jgi:hypothetical protein